MNYVNFNNFQPLNETVYTREEAKTAILMVETKNIAKAEKLVANLAEESNDIKSILSLVENKLDMVSALKSAKELLERNAFLGALAKAREAKAKTFEFNGKEYEVFGADISEEEVVEEKFKYTEDQVNMSYGFYGSLETVYKESQVQKMFTDAVTDLMKAFNISEDTALNVLNAPIGRHVADMIYSKFAATASEGILKYFGGSEVKAKNLINQIQRANEAMNPNVELNEKEYSEDERKAMADKGEALPDGSFPIANKADLENAIHAYGRAGNQSAAAKHIAKRAKSLGLEDLIPTSDDFQKSLKESVNESSQYGAPYGLSKAETKKVAETLAKAISKNDGVKCTVNTKTLEEDSFDLDIDGEEYDGGSYNIYDDGSVRNMAVNGEKYGTVKSTVEDFIKGMKNPIKESTVNEGLSTEQKMVETFLKKIAKEFDYSIQDAARFVKETITKMGLNESIIESQNNETSTINISNLSDIDHTRIVKWMTSQFDSKLWDMKKSGKGFEITVDKLSKAEQEDLMAYLKSQDYITEAEDHEVAMAHNQLLDIAKNASELMAKIGETEKDLPGWVQDHISQAQNFINQANTGYYEVQESKIDEGAVKQFEIDYKDMENSIKRGIGWIDPEYAEQTWENSSDSIDFELVAGEIYKRLIKAGLLWTTEDGETKDKQIKSLKELGIKESLEVNEAKKYDLGFGSLGNGTTVWNRAKEVNGDYEIVAHISVGGNIKFYDKKMPEDVRKQIEDMAANESVIIESTESKEAESILDDLLGERGMDELHGMSMEDALDTVETYGHSGLKAKKIAQELYSLCNESKVTEGVMADIDILAQEAKDFKSFVKEFKKEYSNLDAGDNKELESWLKTVYDSAKENMDESVVNEGDMTKDYDGFVVLDREVNKNYKFKYVKGTNNKKVEDEAIAKLQKQTGAGRHVFMVNGLIKKGEWDKSEFEVLESLEINEKNEVTVSLRYAVQANDIFDDMYRKLGEKESTDVFSFKSREYAKDFIESLIMVGIPKNEIN